jgi:hypothetical protein
VRPEEIRTEEPKPSEIVKLIDELPEPNADEVRELKQRLESLKDVPIADWPAYLRAAREKVDARHSSVVASHRPVIGWAVVLVKRAIGLALQPLINEVLRKQVEFNQAILAAVVQIDDSLQQHLRNQSRWNEEIEARLERLEKVADGIRRVGQ